MIKPIKNIISELPKYGINDKFVDIFLFLDILQHNGFV